MKYKTKEQYQKEREMKEANGKWDVLPPSPSEPEHKRLWRSFRRALRYSIYRNLVKLRRKWLLLGFLAYFAGAATAAFLDSRQPPPPQPTAQASQGTVCFNSAAIVPSPAQEQPTAVPSPAVQPQVSQNVLELPNVDRKFLGYWDGDLKLNPVVAGIEPTSHWNLGIDDQGGKLVLSTNIWGGPNLQFVTKGAHVLSPTHFTFWFETFSDEGSEPIWYREECDARLLTGRGLIQFTSTVKWLKTPGADPYQVNQYQGTLRHISEKENDILTEQLKKKGLQVKGEVSSDPPAQP